MNNENGSISLFILLSALFFLIVVTSVGVSLKNKEATVDRNFEKVKQSYEKDLDNIEQIYEEEMNLSGELKLQIIENKRKTVKLTLSVNSKNNNIYNYKIYVKDGKNEELRIIKEGTTSNNTIIETEEIETFFDVGIEDAYSELEYKGRKNETNHCNYEDLEIKTAEELKFFSTRVNNGKKFENKTITLLEDINLEGTESSQWTAIGNENTEFAGTFYGNGHSITGIYIDGTKERQGLFGQNSGTINKINIINAHIKGKNYVAGIVGYNNGGTIENCDIMNSNIEASNSYCGGIAGLSYSGTVKKCKNFSDIKGSGAIGGIVGCNEAGAIIEQTYNTGKIISNSSVLNEYGTYYYSRAGGICGGIYEGGIVRLSYNEGNIEGNGIQIGGICGISYSGDNISSIIENCYNKGNITIEKIQAGGICGYISADAKVRNCINLGNVSGEQSIGGIAGLTGYTSYRGNIENCYNVGNISSESSTGGISGCIYYGTIKNCYNKGIVTSNSVFQGGITSISQFATSTSNELNRSISNCFYLIGTNSGGIDGQNIANQAMPISQTDLNAINIVDFLNTGNSIQVWKQDSNNINNGYPILNWQ